LASWEFNMIKNFVTKENFGQRMTQLVILVAHLVLLKWILYTLYEGGVLPFKTLMYHFLGISIYGALLIRTCAYIYKRQYLQELKKNGREPKLDE
jgi:apolipoprotein N-acyltransferase